MIGWVATTGGDDHAYGPDGMHARPFDDYAPNLIRFYTEHPEISADAMV